MTIIFKMVWASSLCLLKFCQNLEMIQFSIYNIFIINVQPSHIGWRIEMFLLIYHGVYGYTVFRMVLCLGYTMINDVHT